MEPQLTCGVLVRTIGHFSSPYCQFSGDSHGFWKSWEELELSV